MNLIPILKTFLKRSGRFIVRNSPTILTALSAGGTVTAVIFAVKDTPKAERLIQKRKEELNVDRLPPVEVFKACWPVYIPTAGMTLASIACGIGANSIHLKRQAALVGLYTTTEHTLREYREHVVEAIGEDAEKEIHQKALMAKDHAEKGLPATEQAVIPGDELCQDTYSGQYFRADKNIIKSWESDIKATIAADFYISCQEAYDVMGMEFPLFAEDLGWDLDDLKDFRLDVERCDGEDGRVLNRVTFRVPPHKNYSRMY